MAGAWDASFGLPEVARRVVPTSGARFRAQPGPPLNGGREMILTGERIGALGAFLQKRAPVCSGR